MSLVITEPLPSLLLLRVLLGSLRRLLAAAAASLAPVTDDSSLPFLQLTGRQWCGRLGALPLLAECHVFIQLDKNNATRNLLNSYLPNYPTALKVLTSCNNVL